MLEYPYLQLKQDREPKSEMKVKQRKIRVRKEEVKEKMAGEE